MTFHGTVPEIAAPKKLAEQVARFCSGPDAIERIETMCRDRTALPFAESEDWVALGTTARSAWMDHDHFVIRGLPAAGGGASLLCAASLLECEFRTYREGKIVKHFRASPWTTALSHTVKEGHFHTDLNTDPAPPRVTMLQCLAPDPAAPAQGQVRVARVRDLLAQLEADGRTEASTFLRDDEVTMVSDTSPRAWTGRILSGDTIRFHPETIRAAERRSGRDGSRYDEAMAALKRAAMRVSSPIDLKRGDVLAVSNARALHYRSACTVQFRTFPGDFIAREVYVAHLNGEPS